MNGNGNGQSVILREAKDLWSGSDQPATGRAHRGRTEDPSLRSG